MITRVLISSKAIQYNIRQYKKLVGSKVQLMPVIKANAYGHGFLEVAKICDRMSEVSRLRVVNLAEATRLIKNKIHKPIQILSFFSSDESQLTLAIKKQVRFPVYTIAQARRLNRIGKKCQKKAIIHLKIDIGTTRIGILPTDLKSFIAEIKKFKHLTIEGVFGHFSSSENNPARTRAQNKIFVDTLKKLSTMGCQPTIRHIACTAATTLHKSTHYNAVRVGLGLYGLYPSLNAVKKIKLKPALRWQTKILQIKKIPAKTKIGYNSSYTAPRATRIAILPIGYFDGYDRKFSSRGFVMIKNRQCPVRGKICMNLTMVEIPRGLKVKEGEWAEIIGPKISADTLARIAQTINYEITTRINPQIPRIIL